MTGNDVNTNKSSPVIKSRKISYKSINQSISFNETKNRLKVPADPAAAGTVQWQS